MAPPILAALSAFPAGAGAAAEWVGFDPAVPPDPPAPPELPHPATISAAAAKPTGTSHLLFIVCLLRGRFRVYPSPRRPHGDRSTPASGGCASSPRYRSSLGPLCGLIAG